MPTRFEQVPSDSLSEYSSSPRDERRSVFGNYRETTEQDRKKKSDAQNSKSDKQFCGRDPASNGSGLQSAIDSGVARSFIYGFLARAYADPDQQTWAWLVNGKTLTTFQASVAAVARHSRTLEKTAGHLGQE